MINHNLLRFRPRLSIVLALLALLLAQWPQTAYAAAPSYQEQATAVLGSNGRSLTINKPTGTVQGDLLLAAISVDGTPNISPPTGWTTIREGNSGTQVRLEVYYKVAGASEPSSYTFTWSRYNTQQAAGAILRYSGVNTTAPINTSGIGSGTTISPTAPSVTTTVTDTMVVRIYGADDDDLSPSPYPSGHTGRLNIESNSGDGTCSLGVADVIRASPGATGTAAFSLSASEEWVGVTVALAPAGTDDWGDAPDSYGTTSGANGPHHTVVTGLQMGTAPDTESNGLPGVNANGDDNAGRDDEDGVTSFATLTDQMVGQPYTVTMAVTNTIGSTANLVGWIDFNINGTFDSNEAASTTVANGTTNGSAQLIFTVPVTPTVGRAYARFRLTTDNITASNPGGSATNGEVEDYPITIGVGGQISGHVFRDYDADGVNDANEPGVAGITVTAYDVTGLAVASATTTITGSYTLAGLIQNEEYRIEFTELPSYLQPGPCGTDSETTVTFATSPASGADVGLANPAQYCQSDPKLVTSVYRQNDNTGLEQVLASFDYSASGRTTEPITEAIASQIGTTYGLAYQRSSDTLFAAAYQKRHAGYGSADSTGAIYQIPNPGDGSTTGVSLFVDLNTLFGSAVAGTNPHPHGTDFITDTNSWDSVGKVAFGDMDISEDELSLWTVNLNDRQLYLIPLGTDPTNPVSPTSSAQIARYPLADPSDPLPDLPSDCTNDANYVDIRPFATKVHDGLVYVGLVCSGESTQVTDTLKALVYSFDPGAETFDLVLTFPLTYTRGYAMQYSGTNGRAEWNYWTSTYTTSIFAYTYQSTNGWEVGYAQPMFSDIEFDDQGNMLIGLRDRFGDQFGYRKPDPNGYYPVANGYRGDAVGDILRATPDGSGGWTLSIAEATDGTEFFPNDYFNLVARHDETSEGGLAVLPGQGEVALTIMDPIWDSTGNWAGGVAWMSTSTGARPRSYQVYDTDNNGADPDTFGKGNGLGELEALCDPAPIEIGNRVWDDTDFDGIQDPEEANITGVEVQLWADTDGDSTVDTQVGTATTDANGNYYFGGINNTNMTGGYSVEPNTDYELRISLTDPDLPSGAMPAPQDQGTDLHDSDGDNGVINAGYSTVQFTTEAAGANNHTYDFGFDPPPTAVSLFSFTARPVSIIPVSQSAFSFWLWVGLAGLATLGVGRIAWMRRR
jgi:hypothetical protein